MKKVSIKELSDEELIVIGNQVCREEKCSVSCPFATEHLSCYLIYKTDTSKGSEDDFSEVENRFIIVEEK